MKRALVLGAGGFIGAHMAKRLKAEGCFVRGVGRSPWHQPTNDFNYCDEFVQADLRDFHPEVFRDGIDEVYQFACEVGGLAYITDAGNDAEMLRNSTLIDINVLEACRIHGVGKVFFASSACVYPDLGVNRFCEENAYPANPSNAFAWQKLFAERLYLAYARKYGIDVRIGRLFNCYGRGMTWTGGREKSVAAICRKVAEAEHMQGTVEIWGDGEQRRSFLYVDDAIEGIRRLMQSSFTSPLNIGPTEQCAVYKMAQSVALISRKHVLFKYVAGPVGVPSICCDTTLMKKELGWEPAMTLEQGLKVAYNWVEQRVLAKRQEKA